MHKNELAGKKGASRTNIMYPAGAANAHFETVAELSDIGSTMQCLIAATCLLVEFPSGGH